MEETAGGGKKMEGRAEGGKKKIPGMLYILVSFIPWIVYWVLCGMGMREGIIASFVISLLIIMPQVRRKDLNLMDLTSFLYFVVALAGTFVFRSDAFVENSGVLGYSALSLMAIISLIIRQPFTLQCAKRDYPEAYWRDRSFLAVNDIITGVWAGVFLLNAILFLILKAPFDTISTNILIAFGVLFSVIFPSKAPALFVSREFKKYDWSPEANPRKQKEENEYDIIIIGSGIGGLTCGSLLSKRGYKVLILEQHNRVGGYCSSFQRRGFVFNAGVEDVSGLWQKGPVEHLLKELGFVREDLFVRNTTRYIFRGREIDAPPSLQGFTELLSELFPDEKESIPAFFDDAQKAYEECYREADVYGVPLPAELILKAFGEKKLLDYPKEHPHFYDWMNKTYKQKLDEYFRSEDPKALLCALLGYIGTEPDKTPGLNALTVCVSYYLYGGYFTKGRAQRFVDVLKEFIEDHGGKVLIRRRVDKILAENGRAEGVEAQGETFRAPVIVSDANAITTLIELVGENKLGSEYAKYIKGLKMSNSAFMVFLGVDMDLSGYPILIKNMDEGYDVVINSNADPYMAPVGKSSISLMQRADYCDFPDRGTEEYSRKKKELAEMLIQKAEMAIPDLSKHIVVKDAATPKTFERYALVPEGAIYVFDQSIDTKRPCFKTPIKGLYLVGASTFPGGGIESVVISGTICANDICNWETQQRIKIIKYCHEHRALK